MSSLRKTLDFLASELDAAAELFEQESARVDLPHIEKCYRGGKGDGLRMAAEKIRDALESS